MPDPSPIDSLDAFVFVMNNMENYSFNGTELTGRLVLSDELRKNLSVLAGEGSLQPFVKTEKGRQKFNSSMSTGQIVAVDIDYSKIKKGKFYRTFSEFQEKNSQNFPDEKFYVDDIDYDSTKHRVNNKVEVLRKISKVIVVLREVAFYVKDEFDSFQLVFITDEPHTVSTQYNWDEGIEVSHVDSFVNEMRYGDKAERKKIFNNCISNYLKSEARNFNDILRDFDSIYLNYFKSHQLYLNKFSFEKLRSELNTIRSDFGIRVSSTLNDIQTKLVTIPLAFLVVCTQFDYSGEKPFLNVMLFITSLIYLYIIVSLIVNQKKILKVIREEVHTRVNSLIHDSAIKSFHIKDIDFEGVLKRIKLQNINFKILIGLVCVIPVSVLVLIVLQNFNWWDNFVKLFIGLFS